MATILVVDDHRVTRLGLAEMLGEAGYDVVTAGTFQDARRILRESPPDLLIADVRLGSFNGLQLVISGQHRVPAIVITGYADAVLEAEARRGGADYLVKPFDPDKLLSLIRQKLGTAPAPFAVPRRWRRKSVAGLTAQVGEHAARIVDVSYGGVKFEIRPGGTVPDSFQLRLPNAMSLQADLVWKSMLADDVWVCGAAVWPEESSARQWFGLVDTAS
jgi:DNA-binding response OmpR family regulator